MFMNGGGGGSQKHTLFTRKKSTLPAFLKYLPAWYCVRHELMFMVTFVPAKFLARDD